MCVSNILAYEKQFLLSFPKLHNKKECGNESRDKPFIRTVVASFITERFRSQLYSMKV